MNKIFRRGMQDCRSWKDGFRWGCSWSEYNGSYGAGRSAGKVDDEILVMAPRGLARVVNFDMACCGFAMILNIRYLCPWYRQLFWKKTWCDGEIDQLRVMEQRRRKPLRSAWRGR